MAGRHRHTTDSRARAKRVQRRRSSDPLRKGMLIGGALLVAAFLLVAAAQLFTRDGFSISALWGGGGCDDVADLKVAVDPTIAEQVSAAADRVGTPGCARPVVTAVDQVQAAALIGSPDGSPDLWIPDSSARVEQISGKRENPPKIVVDSIASTPVVVAGKAGELPATGSWFGVLTLPGLKLGDPLQTSTADAPILAALSEAERGRAEPEQVKGAIVMLAQATGSRSGSAPTEEQLLTEVAANGGAAIVTEASVQRFLKVGGAEALDVRTPQNGAVYLDYPVVSTASDESRADAAGKVAEALAEQLHGDAGRAALEQNGLRGADRAPLGGGQGVGAAEVLKVDNAELAAKSLATWRTLAVPSNTIVAIDVSGSMSLQAGGNTRMGHTVGAARQGLGYFSDAAQMGLWAFSTNLGPGGSDHIELVPRRELREVVDGVPQKKALNEALNRLPTMVGGATGLYDTLLAAWREVQANYNPAAVNSVIVLTDGANEDPGSITLEQLLKTIASEADPARPVIIVTVGITEDADAATLKKISEATGGSSAIARTPEEIADVFKVAMASRAK